MGKLEIYEFLNSGEIVKSICFKREGHSKIKEMFLNITGDYEKDKHLSFNPHNWNSFWLETIHDYIDSYSQTITPNLRTEVSWKDDDYLLIIHYKDLKYKVVRYKHRGNIESFKNLETNKDITLDEYLNILTEVL